MNCKPKNTFDYCFSTFYKSNSYEYNFETHEESGIDIYWIGGLAFTDIRFHELFLDLCELRSEKLEKLGI